MPAYFPLELIHAAGGYPVQLWGAECRVDHAEAYLQPYCCSVARSLLELEMRGIAGGDRSLCLHLAVRHADQPQGALPPAVSTSRSWSSPSRSRSTAEGRRGFLCHRRRKDPERSSKAVTGRTGVDRGACGSPPDVSAACAPCSGSSTGCAGRSRG
ncbi:MAG: 2-hydroxyacyl-CoA dehydratase family protein [Desulfomicrobium escambiense]|nr:2-hydroxyacyl-CoA dehydratase family protein [Desulfomicrobium escambiense]